MAALSHDLEFSRNLSHTFSDCVLHLPCEAISQSPPPLYSIASDWKLRIRPGYEIGPGMILGRMCQGMRLGLGMRLGQGMRLGLGMRFGLGMRLALGMRLVECRIYVGKLPGHKKTLHEPITTFGNRTEGWYLYPLIWYFAETSQYTRQILLLWWGLSTTKFWHLYNTTPIYPFTVITSNKIYTAL